MHHYWTGIQPISFASLSRCKLGLWKFVLLQMKSLICLCITSRVMVRWKSTHICKSKRNICCVWWCDWFHVFSISIDLHIPLYSEVKGATTPHTPVGQISPWAYLLNQPPASPCNLLLPSNNSITNLLKPQPLPLPYLPLHWRRKQTHTVPIWSPSFRQCRRRWTPCVSRWTLDAVHIVD